MPDFNDQNTDAINSKSMVTAKNAGDALRQLSSTSAQAIAQSNPLKGDKAGADDAITAPFPGGDQ